MSPRIDRLKPPYMQVADVIRGQIVDGRLQPGDAVPSVRELAATWSIARATAEKVIQQLRSEGLVVTRPGAGATVSQDPPLHRATQDRYRQTRRTGRIYTSQERAEIVAAELVPAPGDVAAALGLQLADDVVRRHRITYLGDEPGTSSTSWFSAEVGRLAPSLLLRERIRQGTGRYVEEMTGRRLSHGQDQVLARLATAEEAHELRLPMPAAVCESRHLAWDHQGQPVTYEVGLARPGHAATYTFEIESES